MFLLLSTCFVVVVVVVVDDDDDGSSGFSVRSCVEVLLLLCLRNCVVAVVISMSTHFPVSVDHGALRSCWILLSFWSVLRVDSSFIFKK